MVRHRGAASPEDAVARGDPRQRRAGAARGLRPVPPGVAAHHASARGAGRRRRRRRATRRGADSGERLGIAHPARTRERLPARNARRAHGDRRSQLVGPRVAAGSGRVDRFAPDGCCAPDPRAPRGRHRPRLARRPARSRARLGRGVLRRPAAPADGRSERAVRDRCALVSDLVGPGHERHLRAGAHAHRRGKAGPPGGAQSPSGAALPRLRRADGRRIRPPSPAGDRRPVVVASRSRGRSRPAGDRRSEPAARPLRGRHSRGRCRPKAFPADSRRLPHPCGVRRGRALPTRIRDRKARCGAVRSIRHRRSPAQLRKSRRPPPLRAVTLAATDPANPYGAALAWPALEGVSHRPGRKAGAVVVLVDGELALYLERGGKSALAFTGDEPTLASAAKDLVARRGPDSSPPSRSSRSTASSSTAPRSGERCAMPVSSSRPKD